MAHSSSDNLSLLEHERRYRYYIAPTDDKAEGDTKAPVNLATTELHNAVIHHIWGQCGRDFIFFSVLQSRFQFKPAHLNPLIYKDVVS